MAIIVITHMQGNNKHYGHLRIHQVICQCSLKLPNCIVKIYKGILSFLTNTSKTILIVSTSLCL